jgi:integrase
LRPGALRALTCGDVDLEAQVVHVTKAFDEGARETKAPKTRNGVRDVPIHPNLVPLLRRLVEGRQTADLLTPLVSIRSEYERAKTLRAHLVLAKVTRPRLTKNPPTTMHVGFRSWRDTGITRLALAGVDVAKMQRRAGHDRIVGRTGEDRGLRLPRRAKAAPGGLVATATPLGCGGRIIGSSHARLQT